MGDLRTVAEFFGDVTEVVVRVVERRVDLEAHEGETFDFTPSLEEPVAAEEKLAHARRRGRLPVRETFIGYHYDGELRAIQSGIQRDNKGPSRGFPLIGRPNKIYYALTNFP